MARVSKGKLARLEASERKKDFALSMQNHPTFKKLIKTNPEVIKMAASFRNDVISEGERLAEIDGYEKGMIDTIFAVMQVLRADYWKKAPKSKWNRFVEDVCSTLDSELCGAITWQDMVDYIHKETGINMKTDWMGRDKRPTPKSLFMPYNSNAN